MRLVRWVHQSRWLSLTHRTVISLLCSQSRNDSRSHLDQQKDDIHTCLENMNLELRIDTTDSFKLLQHAVQLSRSLWIPDSATLTNSVTASSLRKRRRNEPCWFSRPIWWFPWVFWTTWAATPAIQFTKISLASLQLWFQTPSVHLPNCRCHCSNKLSADLFGLISALQRVIVPVGRS